MFLQLPTLATAGEPGQVRCAGYTAGALLQQSYTPSLGVLAKNLKEKGNKDKPRGGIST